MTDIVEQLISAKVLISTPMTWCQGAEAQNMHYDDVEAYSPEACRWCSIGALHKIGASDEAYQMLNDVISDRSTDTFWKFNDTHTHAEVMAALDDAIALARKQCK